MVYGALAVRWLLALLFFTSGASKLPDREGLAEAITRYELIPARYTAVLSRALPALEMTLGVVLALGVLPAVAGWCAAGALLVFAAAVSVNLLRGRRFDCGCAGTRQREIGWPLVARNTTLALIAALAAIWPAGLALWTAGLAGGHVSASTRNLIAVPLAVIAAAAAARSVTAYRSATRAINTASPNSIAG